MSHAKSMLAPVRNRALLPPTKMLPPEKHYRPRRVRGPLQSLMAMMALWVAWSVGVPIWLILVGFLFHAMALGHLNKAGAIAKNQNGIDLLNGGQLVAASSRFEELARTEQGQVGHAVYVFNRAVAFMLEGKLRRAMSLFNAVHHSRAFRYGPNRSYAPFLYAEMAACYGLLDIRAEAHQFRHRANQLLHPDDIHRIAFADAVLALRDGQIKEAGRIIDAHGPSARELLRPPTFKALLVLRLYTLYLSGEAGSADYQHLRRTVEPTSPTEFDYLGSAWPELRMFLQNERLVRSPHAR